MRCYSIATVTANRNGQGLTMVMGLDLDYLSHEEINAYERGNLPML